ncbi:MAG TPA: HAMP domain-containing sensor histidine kinase [Planctomycetota bacterium]|nr:HAMP domain-containing sensor histidine kinase [Planctomycetota bacterium]
MMERQTPRLNCWEVMECGLGPEAAEPCPVSADTASNGTNGGTNGGRLCWAVAGTLSGAEVLAGCAQTTNCLTCDFFNRVKSEEGMSFQLLKLARGISRSRRLHETISQVESLMAIHDRLRSHFDLDATIREITEEARKVTGARRSVVLLVKGKPPALHGEFLLRGKPKKVVIRIDEESASGYAALHDQIMNLRDIYDARQANGAPVFDRSLDRQYRCRTHSFLAVPIHDSEGRVIGVITTANAKKGFFSSDDEWFMKNYATELALAVEKQKFMQQSISALRLASIGDTIAALSHCIKNIAQALRSGSHVVKRALETNQIQDVRVAWEILDRHIERLADLSMDVLVYDPEVRERFKEASLNGVVEHVMGLFREEARARAIQMHFRRGPRVDPAKFNAMGIYRCLVNLISNALDACPLSEGVVTVCTARTGEKEFMVSVTDNGRGMDELTRSAVFELFRTSKPHKGTGLGLSTVAGIVSRHNGRVEIESEIGQGTTFRIVIREDIAVV